MFVYFVVRYLECSNLKLKIKNQGLHAPRVHQKEVWWKPNSNAFVNFVPYDECVYSNNS